MWFRNVDISMAYFQTIIREEDRDKTVFVTRKGLFRWVSTPYGLKNVPSQFARTVELSELTYESCLVFLDDITVVTRVLKTAVSVE